MPIVDDLPGLWEFAVVVLLVAIVFLCIAIPGRIADTLSAGGVAQSLRQIHQAADQAATSVQALNDELAAAEKLGHWRSIMQTALGAVIGLAGGFLGPWVAEAGSLGAGLLRATVVIVPAVAAVLTVSLGVFPQIDRRLREQLERPAEEAIQAPSVRR